MLRPGFGPATGAGITAPHEILVHLRFETARTRDRHALMLPLSDTERLMAARLASLGVQIERRVALVFDGDEGQGMAATLRYPATSTGSGRTHTWLRARATTILDRSFRRSNDASCGSFFIERDIR